MTRARYARSPRLNTSSRLLSRGSRALALEALEARLMLSVADTPVMNVGAATVFLGPPPSPLPTQPNLAPTPFLSPSSQVVQINRLGTISNQNFANNGPAILPGSPAASKPVPSHDTWTLMMARDPNYQPNLLNRDAWSTDGKTPYAGKYPDAQYFGQQINFNTGQVIVNGNKQSVLGSFAQYAANSPTPAALGPLAFSTVMVTNPKPGDANDPLEAGFGAPNTPFTTTPHQLFSLQSSTQFLDYRPGHGASNGNTQLYDQDGNAVGLVPFYQYEKPNDATGAVSYYDSQPYQHLAMSLMDLPLDSSTGQWVNPSGVDANNLLLTDYSDYSASFNWGDAAHGSFDATFASGSPFAQLFATPQLGSDGKTQNHLVISNMAAGGTADTGTYYPDRNVLVITAHPPRSNSMNVITDPNVPVKSFYAIYLPDGSAFGPDQSYYDSTVYQAPREVPLFGNGWNYFVIDLPDRSGFEGGKIPFVVATLPSDDLATIDLYRQYAFHYITNTTGTLGFDPTTNQSSLSLAVTTQTVYTPSTQFTPAASPYDGALLTAYPHQYKYFDFGPTNPQFVHLGGSSQPLTAPSMFGTTRLFTPLTTRSATSAVSSFQYNAPFQGTLNILPMGAFVSTNSYNPNSPDTPSATPEQVAQLRGFVRQLVSGFASEMSGYVSQLMYGGNGVAYTWGKFLTQLAAVVPIADQLGMTLERDTLLAILQSSFTSFFTGRQVLNNDAANQIFGYDPSYGIQMFFRYDPQWDYLYSYAAGYQIDTNMDDLHYAYGYYIRAASILATYVPSFLDSYGDMINLMIKNLNNWDRSDTMFPYLRMFNPFDGHSWAAGVGPVGDGQNQESVSEVINGYSAIVDWAQLLLARLTPSDPRYATAVQIRNLGASLTTFETIAYEQYWMDVDGDTLPQLTLLYTDPNQQNLYAAAGGYVQRYSYEAAPTDPTKWQQEIYASNQFTTKRGTNTFFVGLNTQTNNAEGHYAISMLPITPGSLYLGRTTKYFPLNPDGSRSTVARNVPLENYQNYLREQFAVYGGPGKGSFPISYAGTLYDYQAVFDPQAALARWYGQNNYFLNSPTPNAADDYTHYTFLPRSESYAMSYYWLQTMAKYGQVNGSVFATNHQATAVFDAESFNGQNVFARTYVISNMASTPLASVTFNDGTIITGVPARSVYTITYTRSQPGAPAINTYRNLYTLPDPSTVPASPSVPGTTDLYLGYAPTAGQQPDPVYGVIQPLTLDKPTTPGVATLTAPYPNGPNGPSPGSSQYFYTYGTPVVVDDKYKNIVDFPASTLPGDKVASTYSFQVDHLNGTYNPDAYTDFVLQMKVPFGQINTAQGQNGAVFAVNVQVRYEWTDPVKGLTRIVESYPSTTISGIGGIAYITPRTLGAGPTTPTVAPPNPAPPTAGMWSGVTAATLTYGAPYTTDGNGFALYNPADSPGSVNLLNPWDIYFGGSGAYAQMLDRRVVWTDGSGLQIVDGTVTLMVYVSLFNQNNTSYTNPELQILSGLPEALGLQSKLSVPLTNVTIQARQGIGVELAAPHAVFEGEAVSLVATVRPGTTTGALSAQAVAATPQGIVRFFNGNTALGDATLVNGVARLSPTLLFGVASLRAVYLGDSVFDDSTSAAVDLPVSRVTPQGSSLLVHDPDGSLRYSVVPFSTPGPAGYDIETADINGDGYSDVVVSRLSASSPVVKIIEGRSGRVLDSFSSGNSQGTNIEAGPVNADTYSDVVALAGTRLSVYDGRSGRVVRTLRPLGARARKLTLTLADRNGDGYLDYTVQGRRNGQLVTKTYDGATGKLIHATSSPLARLARLSFRSR